MIVTYVQEMEKRLMTEMKCKRSLYHDVTKVGSSVAVVQAIINDHFKSPNGNPSAWTNIREFEDTVCVNIPFTEMEHFNRFNVALEDKKTSTKFVSTNICRLCQTPKHFLKFFFYRHLCWNLSGCQLAANRHQINPGHLGALLVSRGRSSI